MTIYNGYKPYHKAVAITHDGIMSNARTRLPIRIWSLGRRRSDLGYRWSIFRDATVERPLVILTNLSVGDRVKQRRKSQIVKSNV